MVAGRHRSLIPGISGVLLVLLGLTVTLYWLGRPAARASGEEIAWAALALPGVASLTLLNLGLRWFRWHFLLRRLGLALKTRDSATLYFATLPLLLVPFFMGELLRPMLMSNAS